MLSMAFSDLTRVFDAFLSGREERFPSTDEKGCSRRAVSLDETSEEKGSKVQVPDSLSSLHFLYLSIFWQPL